jgi:hypothetical protein
MQLQVLKACATGSALAAVFLCLMPLISPSCNREKLMVLWSGAQIASPQDLQSLLSHFSILFALVSVYLIGHFLMWLGYGLLIAKQSALLATSILLIGFFSCLCDLSEYCLRSAMLKSLVWETPSSAILMPIWWALRELSIWMIYLGTIVIGIFFLNPTTKILSIVTLAFLGILTIPCLYIFGLSKAWFVWLIAWHGASALFLWSKANPAVVPNLDFQV